MFDLREYTDAAGKSPFGRWFDRLPADAAARVRANLVRLANGNTSNLKALGGGVTELRLDFGPGYRVYLALEAARWVLLLGGGTKRRQDADIAAARAC